MASTNIAQVLVKDDFSKQAMVPFTGALGALASDSVRVRTTVLALSLNNQAYAIMGTALNWWDTYPVPEQFPAPYNDRTVYGVLSGWGYATVVESHIASIQPGAMFKGYFPLSTVPVDLQLVPGKAPGHWIESSAHRANVMHLYQRYQLTKYTATQLGDGDLESMAVDVVVGVLWECSYLVNRFSFSGQPEIQAVNPAGDNLPWSEGEADLSKATVILLAASGKTAMTMAYEMRQERASGVGPLKVVGITGARNMSHVKASDYYNSVVTYGEVNEDLNALHSLLAEDTKRIVVFDFGARGDFTSNVHKALSAKSIPMTIVRVGFENKPYTMEGVMQVFGLGAQLGMVQMNTSPLREQVMAMMGEEKYFREMYAAWDTFKSRGGIPGLKLKWSEGMTGAGGLEGAWKNLCEKDVAPDQAIAVRMM